MPKLDPTEAARRRAGVQRLAMAGMTAKQIAEELQITARAVDYWIRLLMQGGALPPALRRKSKPTIGTLHARLKRSTSRRLGSLVGIFTMLTYEELEWLYDITPEGMTITETLVTLVRDAYAEEKQ